jgi:flavin-dependent dehydrogenase
MHDVVVVGGGISGAATATHLARAGARVLLVDRARFPRRKVCGEGLFPAGVAALEHLGALASVEGSSARINRLRFEFEDVVCVGSLSPSGRHGLGVARQALDTALVETAARSGAEVACGVRVTGLLQADGSFAGVEADHSRFEARVIVAADGIGSPLRLKAGLGGAPEAVRRYGVAAHLGLDSDAGDAISVHFRRSHEVYVTPVGRREVNVAVLLGAREAARLGGRLEAGFREHIRGVPELAAAALLEPPRAAGPFPVRAVALSRENLVLAGDAAGFHDAISGEGMSLALRSAPLAAEAVLRYLETGSRAGFEAYEDAVRMLRRPSTLFARLMLTLRDRPALARRALRNLARRPDSFTRLVGLNGGELGFRDLRPRDLSALVLGF